MGRVMGTSSILGVINPRRACAARFNEVVCVCLCVCLSTEILYISRVITRQTRNNSDFSVKCKKVFCFLFANFVMHADRGGAGC